MIFITVASRHGRLNGMRLTASKPLQSVTSKLGVTMHAVVGFAMNIVNSNHRDAPNGRSCVL